jgi:hypothetical protein
VLLFSWASKAVSLEMDSLALKSSIENNAEDLSSLCMILREIKELLADINSPKLKCSSELKFFSTFHCSSRASFI